MNRITNRQNALATAALLAACTSALYAQAVPPPAPTVTAPTMTAPTATTLRYKFTVGQVHRYQYNMEMEMLMQTGQTGAGIPIAMTTHMIMSQTVKSIRPADGAATLVSQIESMQTLRNGTEVPMPEAQAAQMKKPTTLVMLPTGKVVSMDMPSMSGGAVPGMDFSKNLFSGTAFLPDGPVKVGDSWNGSGMAPVMGLQVALTSTLTGLDQKNGATLATIHTKQTGTMDKPMTEAMPGSGMKMQGVLTGDGTFVFDTAAGALQSTTGSSNADITMTFGKSAAGATPPGMPSAMKMQMQMKYTMALLPGATAAAGQ